MVSRQYFTIQTSSASPTFCKQNFCQMPRSGKINAFGTFFDQKAETKYIQNHSRGITHDTCRARTNFEMPKSIENPFYSFMSRW